MAIQWQSMTMTIIIIIFMATLIPSGFLSIDKTKSRIFISDVNFGVGNQEKIWFSVGCGENGRKEMEICVNI
jgi:hypothetical protein